MRTRTRQPMTQEMRRDRTKVLDALRNPEWTWRTVRGIAEETDLSQRRVRDILARPGKVIIKSEVPNDYEEDLYSHRDHYEADENDLPDTFHWRKLLRAAKKVGIKVGLSETGRLVTGGLPVADLLTAIWEEWKEYNES